MQTLQLTKAPIIASHSAVRKLADVSRNLDDEQLLALKKNGGVDAGRRVQQLREDPPIRRSATAALDALRKEFNLPPARRSVAAGVAADAGARRGAPRPAARRPRARARSEAGGRAGAAARERRGGGRGNALAALTEDQRAALQKKLDEVNAKFPPPPRATVKDFVDHIDYAVKMIGIDHVGISSDFDGGGGVDGWNGADETFNVTLELVRRGYTEPQIAKIWSGNLLAGDE